MFDVATVLISTTSAIGCAFLTVFGANYYNSKVERERRRLIFIQDQVSRFYSPIASIRTRILEAGKVYAQIEVEHNKARERQPGLLDTSKYEAFQRSRHKALLESYESILTLVEENRWLADKSTIEQLGALGRYVEAVRYVVNDGVPSGVRYRDIGYDTAAVVPFFSEINERLTEKMETIRSGRLPTDAELPPKVEIRIVDEEHKLLEHGPTQEKEQS
jgi:hypothetical protein